MTDSTSQFKIEIIYKDIDAAYSKYIQANTNISTLRGWSLTVSLAYFGFLITVQSGNFILLLPYVLFLIPFMYLEAIERDKSRDASEELRLIKNIFNETELTSFNNKVSEYEFRDFRISNRPIFSCYRIWKRFKIIFYPDSLLWYSIQLILLILCIYFIKNGLLKI